MSDSGHTIGEKYDDIHYRCKQEIERLQAELAESQKSGRQAAEAYQSAGEELFKLDKEFEMAKASMIPERLRIARLMAEVEQAKDAVQKQAAFYNIKVLEIEGHAKERILFVERELAAAIVARDLNHEQWKLVNKEWGEAKELERQLQIDLSQPNPNVFVPSATTDGTGNSEAFRELSSLCKASDLESANARLRSELHELDAQAERDLPLKARAQIVYEHQVVEIARLRDALARELDQVAKIADACTNNIPLSNAVKQRTVRMRSDIEAALTVPPVINAVEQTQAINREINRQMSVPTARPIATGRLSQSGTTANTDMAKVNNRPPVPSEVEREAWLDGRAEVKPAKEKP